MLWCLREELWSTVDHHPYRESEHCLFLHQTRKGKQSEALLISAVSEAIIQIDIHGRFRAAITLGVQVSVLWCHYSIGGRLLQHGVVLQKHLRGPVQRLLGCNVKDASAKGKHYCLGRMITTRFTSCIALQEDQERDWGDWICPE